jgi:GST-like protein
MWQMGGLGPMAGQAHHFRQYAPERIQYAYDRYTNETNRLYAVMERRLGEAPYLAGEHYTIADIAAFPWTRSAERQGVDIDEYPNVKRWRAEIEERPTVQKALEVLADRRKPSFDDRAREMLFGASQYQRR